MISVYYDYQIMLAQRFGGISRYIYEISSRLKSLGADVKMRCIHNHNYYFSESLGMYDTSKKSEIFRLSELGIFHYVNKTARSYDLMSGHYDIYHPTYYYASKPERGKLIVTVHDMTHERYSGIYPVNKRVIEAKKNIIPKADRIIAVSENTKRDIINYYPEIKPDKISVIYHGASMKPEVNSSSPLKYDYVLFVGNRGMYKNFSRFSEAMKIIMSMYNDIHVFCAGGGNFTKEEVNSFGNFSSRFHQAALSDNELSGAYENALCFVFPSEYEGFGIPVLEAFACRCPAACSNSSSLPEVSGDSVMYFDPSDIEDMSGAIINLIENPDLRRDLIVKGTERLKLFDWDISAKKTLECYELALKGE